jgi:hypothetical protein
MKMNRQDAKGAKENGIIDVNGEDRDAPPGLFGIPGSMLQGH